MSFARRLALVAVCVVALSGVAAGAAGAADILVR
jgi:uncharacterized membrane protein YtjA (UPF0391 family)